MPLQPPKDVRPGSSAECTATGADPERVISHRFSPANIHQALQTMAGRERNKVILTAQA